MRKYSYLSPAEKAALRLEVRLRLPHMDYEAVKQAVFMDVDTMAQRMGTDRGSAKVIQAEIRRYVVEQWRFDEEK